MSFSQECSNLFGTKNLYELLNLSAEAGKNIKITEIKKAYYKSSLIYHPDRAEDHSKNVATKKFQCLSKAYSILSDKEKRSLYDETGEIEEETIVEDDNKDWLAYWRLLFKKVSLNDIRNFENKYKGSAEERNDLKIVYLKYKGDMNQMLENILCATQEDEDRFVEILKEMIRTEEVPNFDKFSHEPKKRKIARKRKAEKEAKEAAQMLKQITGKSEMNSKDLENAIMQRNSGRAKRMDSFLDDLAAKYQKAETKKRPKNK